MSVNRHCLWYIYNEQHTARYSTDLVMSNGGTYRPPSHAWKAHVIRVLGTRQFRSGRSDACPRTRADLRPEIKTENWRERVLFLLIIVKQQHSERASESRKQGVEKCRRNGLTMFGIVLREIRKRRSKLGIDRELRSRSTANFEVPVASIILADRSPKACCFEDERSNDPKKIVRYFFRPKYAFLARNHPSSSVYLSRFLPFYCFLVSGFPWSLRSVRSHGHGAVWCTKMPPLCLHASNDRWIAESSSDRSRSSQWSLVFFDSPWGNENAERYGKTSDRFALIDRIRYGNHGEIGS